IAYVPRPLYDYVQHAGAVLGHPEAAPAPRARRPGVRLDRWRRAYFDDYLRVVQLAEALRARCAPLPDPARQRALGRFLASERSALGRVWLAGRWAAAGFRREGERALLAGLLWSRLARARGYSRAAPGSQR